MILQVRFFLVGYVISFASALVYLFGTWHFESYWKLIVSLLFVSAILVILLVSSNRKSGAPANGSPSDRKEPVDQQETHLKGIGVKRLYRYRWLLTGLLVLLTLLGLAVFIFYLRSFPANPLRVWQGGAFIISLSASVLYYVFNIHRFHTLADKVTFFTGFALGPATALGFFIQ